MNAKLALPIYFLLSLLVFMPGHGGMLVTDVNGWFDTYMQMGWRGLFTSFNDQSLHYAYHLISFICFKVFGFNTIYWAMFACLLHALAATMGYVLFRRIYTALNLR